MTIQNPNKFHAYGSVSAAGAKVSGAGFVSANTGVGTNTLTLDQGVKSTACACIAVVRGATDGYCTVAHTSDTVKTVNAFDKGGVAQDVAFDFLILRAPG